MDELDPNFVSNIDELVDAAGKISDAAKQEGQPRWFLGDLSLWDGDTLDSADIANAFSREEVGEAYADVLNDEEGSPGETASCKIQSDYQAAEERSFRLRHMSPIRSVLHAASRRLGHSDPVSGCPARVQQLAQDLLEAGGAEA